MIAGSSEEDEDYGCENSEEDQARLEDMRNKLLSGLKTTNGRNKDLQADDDLDIQFGVGFGVDIGKKLLEKKEAKKEKESANDFQKWQEKKADRKRSKKVAAKEK